MGLKELRFSEVKEIKHEQQTFFFSIFWKFVFLSKRHLCVLSSSGRCNEWKGNKKLANSVENKEKAIRQHKQTHSICMCVFSVPFLCLFCI